MRIPFLQKTIRFFLNRVKTTFLIALTFILILPHLSYAQLRINSPKNIVDQFGRSIAVGQPFQKIISLYGAHTENLFALGLDKEIIGVSRHEVFPEAALKKPAFSYREDPEKFLAVRPDLVLIRPMIDRSYPQLVQRLERHGITVVSLQPGTIEEMYVYWKILGILTGKQAEAAHMVRRFRKGVADFQSLAQGITPRKKVYFEAIHSKMKTFSPDSMTMFVLKTAGGVNVAEDAIPVRNTNIAAYGKERILSHAEEIEVYLAQSGVMNHPTMSLIKNEAGFGIIRAVKEDQIYFIDEMIVSRPTMRLLMGIYEIGKAIYPDVFTADQMPVIK